MAPRILVLSAPFGSGHYAAAKAIAQACRDLDHQAYAEAVNIESSVLNAVSTSYLALLKVAPAAYRNLYYAPVGHGTRRFIRSILLPTVRQELLRHQPSMVVATHPFPGAVAASLRRQGRLQAPVAMALTDFAPHPLWVHEGVDRYFVASAEVARGLEQQGVNRERISVTGIPIRSEFTCLRSRPAGRNVLVMGGGLGLGPITQAVGSLLAVPQPDLRVAVICGTNEALWEELTRLYGHDPRATIFGYTDRVPDLMARADLLVSKPGGLTCSEAMACGLPILLLQPLPGHEEENAEYLARTGCAMVVDERTIGQTASQLLFEFPERLAFMRACARLYGRPEAGAAMAQEILMQPQANHYTNATA